MGWGGAASARGGGRGFCSVSRRGLVRNAAGGERPAHPQCPSSIRCRLCSEPVYSELGVCRAWHLSNVPHEALVLPTSSPQSSLLSPLMYGGACVSVGCKQQTSTSPLKRRLCWKDVRTSGGREAWETGSGAAKPVSVAWRGGVVSVQCTCPRGHSFPNMFLSSKRHM